MTDFQSSLEEKQKEVEEEKQQQKQQLRPEAQEKAEIIEMSKTNPRIKGIINGELRFYIEPLPSYAASEVKESMRMIVNVLEHSTTTIPNVEMYRVYDENSADIHISWIKNYRSHTLSGAITNSYIKIGLGADNCLGDWRPFDALTIYLNLLHEFGHSLGYGHSDDPDNIMYHQIYSRFETDVVISDIFPSGSMKIIPFCGSGYYFYTFSTDNVQDDFDIYVLPSETDPQTFLGSESGSEYVDCGEKDTMNFTHSCNVSADSKIVIHNYESYPIKINGQIVDKDVPKKPDMDYDEEALNMILNSWRIFDFCLMSQISSIINIPNKNSI